MPVVEMAAEERDAVFALLDDSEATALCPSTRLYTGFVRERVCTDAAQLDAVVADVVADQRAGLHVVVLADYEFGHGLAGIHTDTGSAQFQATQRGDAPLRFLLFERCARLSREAADAWLAQRDGGATQPSVAGTANLRASVDNEQFAAAIEAIHAALRDGDSYQVNYTYRLAFDVFGAPLALYRRLRDRQPVPFGALIALPDGRWVLSCSPELFVGKTGTTLLARPMKGTAPRAADPLLDRRAADFLASDPKNRAENVMIVDLLRNDLSRVAHIGSVRVPALFSVEPYASVWQMTSTVTAALRSRTSFADVLRALFPCGSITGAPKHRTMQLIDTLETTPRGLYTGAIGWLDAPVPDSVEEELCGDFCLSVAIRTLTLEAADRTGKRHGTMGVGAGIVLDSVAADEYEECQLKARFLTEADPGFELFETMYATHEDGIRHLERHLARVSASARYFDFPFDVDAVREQLEAQRVALPPGVEHRVRLAVGKSGDAQIVAAPLAVLPAGEVGVLLAPERGFAATQADDPLLRHKTTRRADYDRGWREAEAHHAFDTLFFNERDELTEGGRTNVFVKLDGAWWTPPLDSGVLPGVMRAVLLEDPTLRAAERVLTRTDLLRADALILSNALRGVLPARIVSAPATT
ncbi:para-aminobenzoate synthetase / 4-amino-4-deoxychorismate lyase [Paraburkholderia megapolitana]|uniref:Para-aminobenzoate synthetase / 4-amino-4-deoxychorismate lyase n=2 Tax=Paraburkholderia megapolitana TaxID=420953 RepID=A0A1I3GBM9_9BURK|nr:para-aminobenzoate synthetase / 4-amino-4-deoxychorismate lyase [Paraburkholderia megapolitana]